MISSAKNQIVRQKKIEMCGIPVQIDEDSISRTHELKDSNRNSLEADFECSNSSLDVENISSSVPKTKVFLESSSDANNEFLKPFKSEALSSEDSKSSTSGCSVGSTNNNYCSSKPSPKINSGSKLQISNVLLDKLRRSKSPNPSRKPPLNFNNSMPSEHQKAGKLTNLSNRLSNQAGSFFSRSCQGEELTNECVEKTESKSDLHTTKIKNFLNFSRSGGMKSSFNSPKKFNSSGLTSQSLSIEDHDSLNSSYSSPVYSKQSSFNSYDIDFEKLVKELVLPSLDEPLTSFRNKSPETSVKNKPVLQSCKTIDASVENKRKQTIVRANTENK